MRAETQCPNQLKLNGKLERFVIFFFLWLKFHVFPFSPQLFVQSGNLAFILWFFFVILFFFFDFLPFGPLFSSGPNKAHWSDAEQGWKEKTARGARELLHLVYWPLRCGSWRARGGDQGRYLAQPAAVLPGRTVISSSPSSPVSPASFIFNASQLD